MIGSCALVGAGAALFSGSVAQLSDRVVDPRAATNPDHQLTTTSLDAGDGSPAIRFSANGLAGDRDGDPLTNPVCDIPADNCQDREPINGPAYRLGFGRQNNSYFKRFDEFRLASSGYVKQI